MSESANIRKSRHDPTVKRRSPSGSAENAKNGKWDGRGEELINAHFVRRTVKDGDGEKIMSIFDERYTIDSMLYLLERGMFLLRRYNMILIEGPNDNIQIRFLELLNKNWNLGESPKGILLKTVKEFSNGASHDEQVIMTGVLESHLRKCMGIGEFFKADKTLFDLGKSKADFVKSIKNSEAME